jgi:hypothetical protein
MALLNDCSLHNRLAKNAIERVQEFSTIAFAESFQASVLDAVQAPETAR